MDYYQKFSNNNDINNFHPLLSCFENICSLLNGFMFPLLFIW